MERAQSGRNFDGAAGTIDGLAPSLYPYQAAAINWMTAREAEGDAAPLRALATALLGRAGEGALRGGILADEMGLGKTVTLVALVLYLRAGRE